MRHFFLITILFSGHLLMAQTITGSWYGKADVDMAGSHNNYLTELTIKQKGDEIEGIFAYYFKNVHQSFYVHGSYNAKTKEIRIPNIPVIYFNTNSTVNSIECNTEFIGTLFVSKVKKAINGRLYRDEKYKYTCPDLRVTYTLDTAEDQNEILKNAMTGKVFWAPSPEDFVVSTNSSEKKELAPASMQPKVSLPTQPPVLQNIDITPAKMESDAKKITQAFESRKSIYFENLEVSSDSVELSFYDNGDIDGDSISIFLNNKLVLSHQGLTERAINVFMRLDSTKEINEVSMFAENLGSIPPNTALMVISDGTHRYDVYMSSSLTQNSTVRLKRKRR